MRVRVCTLALLLCACRPSDPKDPNTWLKRLSDSDPRTRQQAVQELRKLKAKEAAPQVAQLLKDVMVREEAATALRDLGGADEVPALLDAVDTTVGAGSDTATRSANRANARIAEALGEIGDPRAGPALLRLARSKDEYVRLEAVQALGEVKFKEGVPELSLLVDDPSAPPVLVKRAVVALGQMGDPAAIPALQHALVLEQLRYKDPDPLPGTARLLTNLVRQFAANALGRLRAKDAAAPILALVQTRDPQDFDLVSFCSEALVWIGDRAQAKEMMKRAESGDVRLRLVVAQAAALFADESLLQQFDALGARARKAPPAQCAREVEALQIGEAKDKACELVAAQFEGPAVALEAAHACKDSAPCWLDKLKYTEPLLRSRAAYELGRLGAGDAVPSLVQAAGDQDLLARVAAIRALEWLLGVPAAQPQLKVAAEKLSAQLAAEQGRVQFVKVNEELRRLQARMAHL